MTLPLYPRTPAPAYGLKWQQRYRTVVSPLESAITQAVKRWTAPRYTCTLAYQKGQADLETVIAFHRARGGRAERFDFADPVIQSWTGLRVGTGDGTTTTFDLPADSVNGLTVYVDGTATSATLSAGTGANGRDQITFGTAPAAGAVITADLSGHRFWAARFADDEIEWSVTRLRDLAGARVVEVAKVVVETEAG